MNNNNTDSSVNTPVPATAGEKVRTSLILMVFDADSRIVSVELEPTPEAPTASIESLHAQLVEDGYGEFYTSDDVLRPVVLAANNAQKGVFIVAEQRDAKLDLTISADKLAVHANVTHAYGGRALTREWLDAELRELGVPSRCLLPNEIDALVDAGEGQHVLIAQAVLPKKGGDAQFEVLVEACKNLQPQEDEHGCVNFYQSHEFVVVDEGAPLMRRIPPTAGKMGIDVGGAVLAPEAGSAIPFSRDLVGSQLSAGDPNLLVAATKGHPIASATGVNVDPTLRVKNVSLATGNVSFDGSVEIEGDVASGLSVQATGDIFIRGMVEKARITARRNLVVQGGVMGDDLGRDDKNELILRTRLRAGGNISAKFVNFTEVVAGQNILVREYVMQSHLRAQGVIAIGQEGGKGSLIGGKAQAGEQLAANILGSDAYVLTEVRVGKDNAKRRWLEQLKQAYKQTQHNTHQLQQLLEASGASLTAEKRSKITHTITAQQERQSRIRMIVERLLARQRPSLVHQITVKRALHANVSLTIDGVTHISEADGGARTLVRSGADLMIKN